MQINLIEPYIYKVGRSSPELIRVIKSMSFLQMKNYFKYLNYQKQNANQFHIDLSPFNIHFDLKKYFQI